MIINILVLAVAITGVVLYLIAGKLEKPGALVVFFALILHLILIVADVSKHLP